MVICVVPGCENYETAKKSGVSFQRFPKNPNLRRAWLVKFVTLIYLHEHQKTNCTVTKFVGVTFYRESDYNRDLAQEMGVSKVKRNRLKGNAVPSVFPFKESKAITRATSIY